MVDYAGVRVEGADRTRAQVAYHDVESDAAAVMLQFSHHNAPGGYFDTCSAHPCGKEMLTYPV